MDGAGGKRKRERESLVRTLVDVDPVAQLSRQVVLLLLPGGPLVDHGCTVSLSAADDNWHANGERRTSGK